MFNLFCGPVRHRHRVQRGHVLDVRLRHRHGRLAPRNALLRARRCERHKIIFRVRTLVYLLRFELFLKRIFFSQLQLFSSSRLLHFDFQFFFSPPIMAYGSGEAFLKFFLQVRKNACGLHICIVTDVAARLCHQ